jgi:hypothetical protein
MIDSQYIFPATLSALTILATVLNFTAHFSNGEYLSWKAFNRISGQRIFPVGKLSFKRIA